MDCMFPNEGLESHANKIATEKKNKTALSITGEEWTGKIWKHSYLWINDWEKIIGDSVCFY